MSESAFFLKFESEKRWLTCDCVTKTSAGDAQNQKNTTLEKELSRNELSYVDGLNFDSEFVIVSF